MEHTLAEVIVQRRKALGMTQGALAEKLGVTDKAVSKWERGLSCPDVASLPALAEALGVSMEELMTGCKPAPAERPRILDTVLKAVALAMGIAVTVLMTLGVLETEAALTMLGIGLACLALAQLRQ